MLRTTFSSVIEKRVCSFTCDRASSADVALRNKLDSARAEGAVVITTPQSLKSLMLKFVENLTALTNPHDPRHDDRELKPATEIWEHILKLMGKGVCIMDEGGASPGSAHILLIRHVVR